MLTPEEFEVYRVRYKRSVLAIARRLAHTNDELCDELEQVGWIALWKFDPSKVKRNHDGCLKQHLRNRMTDYIRSSAWRDRALPLFDTDQELQDLTVDDAGIPRYVPGYDGREVSGDTYD